jgi:hypothetical protein
MNNTSMNQDLEEGEIPDPRSPDNQGKNQLGLDFENISLTQSKDHNVSLFSTQFDPQLHF